MLKSGRQNNQQAIRPDLVTPVKSGGQEGHIKPILFRFLRQSATVFAGIVPSFLSRHARISRTAGDPANGGDAGITVLSLQNLALKDAVVIIKSKDIHDYLANLRKTDEPRPIQLEVLMPFVDPKIIAAVK